MINSKIKNSAIKLRQKGRTYNEIEKITGIKKSTLSGWFKTIILSSSALSRINNRKAKHLISARKKSCDFHRNEKLQRIQMIHETVDSRIATFNITDPIHLEIALIFLYLGEGFKSCETGLGNSNPDILRFFIHSLQTIYGVKPDKFHCELHLRADQNESVLKRYWSKELNLPLSQFRYVYKDPRTKGTKTLNSYKGVCSVRCGSVDTNRRLLYTAKKLLETFNAPLAHR